MLVATIACLALIVCLQSRPRGQAKEAERLLKEEEKEAERALRAAEAEERLKKEEEVRCHGGPPILPLPVLPRSPLASLALCCASSPI